jgi:hypothetical protein
MNSDTRNINKEITEATFRGAGIRIKTKSEIDKECAFLDSVVGYGCGLILILTTILLFIGAILFFSFCIAAGSIGVGINQDGKFVVPCEKYENYK